MPYPEVIRMRKKLGKLLKLASEAAEIVGEEEVEKLLSMWGDGKLSTNELKRRLEILKNRR